MEIRQNIYKEDKNFLYGFREQFLNDIWIRIPNSYFVILKTNMFSNFPKNIFDSLNIDISFKRMLDFNNIVDSNYKSYYYLAIASEGVAEEALKWIMGPIAEKSKETNNYNFSEILSASKLNMFCRYLKEEKFERIFAKEIFNDILKGIELEEVLLNPKYKTISEEELKNVIQEIVKENSDKQIDEKMKKWLVGQVMKRTNGKANPNLINKILETI